MEYVKLGDICTKVCSGGTPTSVLTLHTMTGIYLGSTLMKLTFAIYIQQIKLYQKKA